MLLSRFNGHCRPRGDVRPFLAATSGRLQNQK
jgi:hypothetical protein